MTAGSDAQREREDAMRCGATSISDRRCQLRIGHIQPHQNVNGATRSILTWGSWFGRPDSYRAAHRAAAEVDV